MDQQQVWEAARRLLSRRFEKLTPEQKARVLNPSPERHQFLKELRLENSVMGQAVLALPEEKFVFLKENIDPSEEQLMHVCDEYFVVDRGGSGSQGIQIEFPEWL